MSEDDKEAIRVALAVACASGGFKGVFVHGVLSAFENAGLRVDAYAASSASVASAGFAVVGRAREVGVEYWVRARRVLDRPGHGMSQVVQECINSYASLVRPAAFQPGRPRLLVAASQVVTPEASALTQGDGARRLGRRLLVEAARGDRSWVDKHLARRIFDSQARGGPFRLGADNFDQVAYASTRMLHAWDIPAWIDGVPFVDASYTCLCPAIELAERGYSEVIAVAAEPGPLWRDLFGGDPVPTHYGTTPLRVVRPEQDPQQLGVDFASATEEGLLAAYRHGEHQGRAFLAPSG
jgi:hypothetical protein